MFGGASGLSTVQFVVATGFALVVFVVLANILVALYARGAARAALDEALRTGSRADVPIDDCEARFDDALRGLLGANLRSGTAITCRLDAGHRLRATVEVRIAAWVPGLPAWTFHLERAVPVEQVP